MSDRFALLASKSPMIDVTLALIMAVMALSVLWVMPAYARNPSHAAGETHKSSHTPVSAVGFDSFTSLSFTPIVTATKIYTLVVDNNGNGQADPGDTLRYTIVIANSGDMDAENTIFSDMLDSNLALSGTVKVSPLARTDYYSATGNIAITVSAPGVLSNDNDPDGGPVTATPFSGTGNSANGGDVTLDATGAFTYNPPAGFEGNDTFNYTITDDEGDSDVGTASISVNDMIWFINNDPGANPGNDGRLRSPFATLAAFEAANGNGGANDPQAGDNIFVYESGSGDYTGGLTLENSQRLIGQGATASLTALTGIAPPPNSDLLPSTGGSKPNLTSLSNVINIADSNNIVGLDLAASSGVVGSAGIFGNGKGGTSTVDEVSIVTSNSGNGVILNNQAGGFTMSNGSITGGNPAGAVGLNAGSGNVSFTNVNISKTGGGLIAVTNKTGGSVIFAGGMITGTNLNPAPLASTIFIDDNSSGNPDIQFNEKVDLSGTLSTAVLISDNTGATIVFTDLNIDNTATNQTGLLATNNGMATGGLNTTTGIISTGSAAAIDIDNTRLGVILESISSDGGSVPGLDLLNTTGSFTVTGDGATGPSLSANNGSGGSIENKTTDGVSLTNVSNVSLNYMNIRNNGDSGVAGSNVAGFTMTRSNVTTNTDSFNPPFEAGLAFYDSAGTFSISNTLISDSFYHNVFFENSSGALDEISIHASELGSGVANDSTGVLIHGLGTASISSTMVTDSTFDDNPSDGILYDLEGDSKVFSAIITGNTFTSNDQGVYLSGIDNAELTAFDVSNNSFTNQTFDNIEVNLVHRAQFTGTINLNTVGTPGVAASGSTSGKGVRFFVEDEAFGTVAITNNTIDGIAATHGISVQAINSSATYPGPGTLNLTLLGNDVDLDATAVDDSNINVRSRTNKIYCANLQNNSTNALGLGRMRVTQNNEATFQLERFVGDGTSGTQVAAHIQSENPGANSVSVSVNNTFAGVPSGTCLTP